MRSVLPMCITHVMQELAPCSRCALGVCVDRAIAAADNSFFARSVSQASFLETCSSTRRFAKLLSMLVLRVSYFFQR